MPKLGHLRHLLLCGDFGSLPASILFFKDLNGLNTLETLSVGLDQEMNIMRSQDTLNLVDCAALRAICIVGIFSGQLALQPSCQFTMRAVPFGWTLRGSWNAGIGLRVGLQRLS